MKVVGTMFFENEKLLIDKPRKRPTYQMIGGKVEDGETTLQAAIRECHEELGDEAIFDEEKFENYSRGNKRFSFCRMFRYGLYLHKH